MVLLEFLPGEEPFTPPKVRALPMVMGATDEFGPPMPKKPFGSLLTAAILGNFLSMKNRLGEMSHRRRTNRTLAGDALISVLIER